MMNDSRMKLIAAGSIVLALMLGAFSFASATGENASIVGKRAKEFTLKDQFGKSLTYRFPKQKVSVLTFGDWKGSSQIEGWVQPIWERYGERIDIHGVAVLDIVPSMFHDFAREQFKDRVEYPVLLDFEGDVSSAYDFRSDNANVLIIAPSGRVTLRAIGAANEKTLQRLYAEIDRLIAGSSKRSNR